MAHALTSSVTSPGSGGRGRSSNARWSEIGSKRSRSTDGTSTRRHTARPARANSRRNFRSGRCTSRRTRPVARTVLRHAKVSSYRALGGSSRSASGLGPPNVKCGSHTVTTTRPRSDTSARRSLRTPAHLGVALEGAEHATADHEIERSRRRDLAPLIREPQLVRPPARRPPAGSMDGVGVVAEDLHPLARQGLGEPPVAAAVVEHALGPPGHVEHDVVRLFVSARESTDRLVESVESVELGDVGAVQRLAHDRLEVGPAPPSDTRATPAGTSSCTRARTPGDGCRSRSRSAAPVHPPPEGCPDGGCGRRHRGAGTRRGARPCRARSRRCRARLPRRDRPAPRDARIHGNRGADRGCGCRSTHPRASEGTRRPTRHATSSNNRRP